MKAMSSTYLFWGISGSWDDILQGSSFADVTAWDPTRVFGEKAQLLRRWWLWSCSCLGVESLWKAPKLMQSKLVEGALFAASGDRALIGKPSTSPVQSVGISPTVKPCKLLGPYGQVKGGRNQCLNRFLRPVQGTHGRLKGSRNGCTSLSKACAGRLKIFCDRCLKRSLCLDLYRAHMGV